MAPDRLLPILLGAALGGAGWLQFVHERNTRGETAQAAVNERIARLDEELSILRRENESLRSLAEGGGALAVPDELLARVEREFGLEFRSNPVVHRVPREVLAEQVGASLAIRHEPQGLGPRESALRMIGWLDGGDSLPGLWVASRAIGARAWFDDVSGEAWVPEDHDRQSIPDQAALLRVLVRILLHQHLPPPAGYPGDEVWRVREALHGGAAAGAEARFFAANARAIGFMPMNEEANVGAEVLRSLPPFLQGLATFASFEGKGFTDVRYLAGPEELLETLHNPPPTTWSILFPGEPEPATPAPPLPATPGDTRLEDSAGALGVRLLATTLEDESLAVRSARAWRGDRWRLFADTHGEHLVWVVAFADADTAEAFAAAVCDLAAIRAGLDEPPPDAGEFTTPDGRWIRIDQPRPDRVRLLNLADPEVAGELETRD